MAIALDKVREIAERVALSSGLVLWDLELKGSGAARTLRIYIDKQGGISHEDCATFSREVSTIFDVEDAVPGGAYLLEVSSPGMDRKLLKPEHFTQFTGSLVKFATRRPLNENRNFEGRLVAFAEGKLTINLDEVSSKKKAKAQGGGTIEVELTDIEKASVVPEF